MDDKTPSTLIAVGDGYRNVVANLGTERDKATGGSYVTTLHNAAELLTMYRSSWLARKIVDIPAFDSIRRWRNWNAEKDDITKIENEERRLGLQKKVQSALTLARLYGGAAIFISTKETDVSKPLSAKEEVSHLTVIPRQMLFGDLTQTDISSSRFGLPVFYTVNSTGISMDTGGQQKIHHSRLVKFTGADIPWGDTQIHEDWGDSVLTAMMDAIHRADSTAANIASLVFEAKVDVIHVPKLMQLISTPEGEVAVKEYIRLAMQTKSINGALILDGGDTTKSENESGGTRYDAKSASFAGLDSVFDRFLQAVSGAADIPATRLLGQAPAGMNATGESDLRNYYDHIQSIQMIELGPEMAMLDEMLVRQATGKGIGEIWYDWRPLWQPTDEQKLSAGKQVAGIVGDMAKLRLWPDEVLSKAGANAMVETGALPGLEAAIDEWTEEEGDLFVEPEAGEGEPDVNQVPPGGNVVQRGGMKAVGDAFDPSQPRDENGRWASVLGPRVGWDDKPKDDGPLHLMPVRVAPKETIKKAKAEVSGGIGWDNVQAEEFTPTLDNLVASQDVLQHETMRSLAKYMPELESKLFPGTAYESGGRYLIFDGHHRAVAAALAGRSLRMKVYHGSIDLGARETVKDANPYRDERGRFTNGPHAVSLKSGEKAILRVTPATEDFKHHKITVETESGDRMGTFDYTPAKNRFMWSGVDEVHRGKGVATAVYNFVEGVTGKPVVPNQNALTDDGEAFWKSRKRVVADMAPRALYVRRDVLNAEEILEWARGQGIQNLTPAEELHTTVVYSREPVDWMKVGEPYEDRIEIKSGGPRSVEQFGTALVLEFASYGLAMRHGDAERAGATWDHDEYRPHVTLSYDPGVNPEDVEPYRGPIDLGPEIFENLDPTKGGGKAAAPFVETADANPNHYPAGTPGGKGGEFAPKPGDQLRW